MDDVVKEFLVESGENLDRLDQDFVLLEKSPNDKELLSSVFRAIHTIKGTCGFIGFNNLEKVTHAGENLLSKLRDGEMQLNPEITNALLAMVDTVRKILAVIEETGCDGTDTHPDLIAHLNKLSTGVSEQSNHDSPTEKTSPEVEASTTNSSDQHEESNEPSGKEVQLKDNKSVSDTTIRVEIDLLDKLMNLVGELVLSRNQIMQFTSKEDYLTLHTATQHLDLITSELQENVMKTRMQPISNIWNKFPRIVRDLAHSLGKEAVVIMEGKDTEIDKSIIESIKDPLTHIVRNSVDHGIELPEARKNAGKSKEAVIKLKAYHEGGIVNIEISDDGSGIDLEKVKKKALEKGLFTAEQLAHMKESEITNMIFMPGFSTAEKVTNISGRGVGMDVVKTNIEKIGGSIDVKSHLNQGTTIKIKIPLTLAIIPALIVTCNNECYAIPQVNLVELILVEEEAVKTQIEYIQNIPVYRLRGKLLPLIYLGEVLNSNNNDGVLSGAKSIHIIVLEVNDYQYGLVVDGINDKQEIVVKPLSHLLKGVTAFSGATIMGNGDVALILDAVGLAQLANITHESSHDIMMENNNSESNETQKKMSLLLIKSGAKRLMAIPLNYVSRLEEFAEEKIEYSGNAMVVQYRNKIMPLINVSRLLGDEPTTSDANEKKNRSYQVVVISYDECDIGLIVENIIDISETSFTPSEAIARTGVSESAVIHGKVTEILDIKSIMDNFLARNSVQTLNSEQVGI